MKKQWIIACLAGVLTAGAQAQQSNYVSEVWVADQGNSTYKNPVLYADYSDPDVCRVGDDFYLTSSSFGCLPGLQILHSKDLVNWSIISADVPAALPPVTTPELAKAAKVVLVHRGDGATGWSMGWKLNQWARLHDGNHAYTLFGNLLKNGTLDNLWDTHSPFQIDGNFGGTAGITEMLLQSHMGFIQLLPALPDAWKEGSVSGICAKGNFEVDMVWENNQLKEAVVHSNAGGNCVIKYADKTLSFKTVKGRSYRVEYDVTKGLIRQ